MITDYKPLENNIAEELLEAFYNGNNKILTDFADAYLMPKKKGLYGPSYDLTLYVTTENLKFLIEKNGKEQRKLGDLNFKHSIDVAITLLMYDIAENIDYKTINAALDHDLPEEDKKTETGIVRKASIYEIKKFLEKTIDSIHGIEKMQYKGRNYENVINDIPSIIQPLIDPFYDGLLYIAELAKAIPESNYNGDKDIKDLVALVINEKKDFDLYVGLKSIAAKIKRKIKKNPFYFEYHPRIKGIIGKLDDTSKNYIRYAVINIFSPDEIRIKRGLADKLIKIKFGDSISQNYETVEKEPSKGDLNYDNFMKKHNYIREIGQFVLDRRKKKVKDDEVLIRKGEVKIIKEDITLGEYKSFEDFKIPAHEILVGLFKKFIIKDRGSDYFNRCYFNSGEDYDATMLNLLVGSGFTAINQVIDPRINHLVNYFHVKKNIAKKIQRGVRKYRDIFRLTNNQTKYDIFRRYEIPAMEGNNEMITNLNLNKRDQLTHLEIFKRIFEITSDVKIEVGAKLEDKLPVFGWGRFLNQFYNHKNGIQN